MITREDQKYILALTKELLPSVMKEIGFDPTLKEVGHSFGEKLEEELVQKFHLYKSSYLSLHYQIKLGPKKPFS